jgi:protein TonB
MNQNNGIMFADSLLEPSIWGDAHRRTATTLVALILQSLPVCILCLTSLYYTPVSPKPASVTTLVAPPPLATPALGAERSLNEAKVVRKPLHTPTEKLVTPTKIPKALPIENKTAPPPPPDLAGGVADGVPGGVPGGALAGIVGSIAPPAAASPSAAAPKRLRVSEGLVGGLLVHKVMPSYPRSAQHAHISGSVVLRAVISKDGSIEDLKAVQGDPLLTSAAIDAVKQWRYRPYLLNGQPVEVETIITVNFTAHG